MKKILFILLITCFGIINAQTKKQAKEIATKSNQKYLQSLALEYFRISKNEKKEALTFAKKNKLPITFFDKDGTFNEIQKIINGKPLYYKTFNSNAAKSTRANFLHDGGGLGLNIEGQNMVAYVWDGGLARTTHQEFNVGGSSKITVNDGSTYVSGHATHVSGTIAAKGLNTTAKGLAPKASIISSDWNSDIAEITTAASNGMLFSNHSYGYGVDAIPDWQLGAYITDTRKYDNILYNAPYYCLVSAAGNDGGNFSGNADPLEGNHTYDKLSYIEVAKNPIVVANGVDLYVDSSNGEILGNINLNNSSSQGPTDDYRIKPDITGNGTGVYSSVAYQDEQVYSDDPEPTIPSDNDYRSWDGTSMASPGVMASLMLLQQLYHQTNGSFALAATIKGLALHTADDGGPIGPDARYGWGYMNTKKAAEVIISDSSLLTENTLNQLETTTYSVISSGLEPLIASISWTDPPANNVNYGFANRTDPILVNDLDIRISKDGVVSFPWKLTSVTTNAKMDNNVDPYERIEIENPSSGSYNITINHKGSLTNSIQNYTLIVTGITSSSLSINNSSILKNVMIWPNPSQKMVNISLNSFINTSVTVKNIVGEIVYYNYYNSNKDIKQLNLSKLTAGIYMISIKQNNKIYNTKLILK